ncbi:guanylin-like [Conger conger]|uniref:guanylin-like n=1 Tax=Conger conger TaxID=82655 RepID=UPI002A5A0DF8|nr:guanylin-like [Conger conger]
MKTTLSITLLALAASLLCDAVQVKEGEFTFSLESVKKLKDLMDKDLEGKQSPRLAKASTATVCSDPALLPEFLPVCRSDRAGLSLSRLAFIGLNYDECEICMFAACTGC